MKYNVNKPGSRSEIRKMTTGMKSQLLVLFALVLFGCGNADFHQYTGAQQNWPTSSGTFVSTKYDVPAYYGPPNRQYTVLGSLDVTTGPPGGNLATRAEDGIEFAAGKAKKMGADAIIVQRYGKAQAGSVSMASASTNSSYSGDFSGDIVGNSIYGQTSESGYSNTNFFGGSMGSYQGKASVLVIKFKV
jgi:hypothetical protein